MSLIHTGLQMRNQCGRWRPLLMRLSGVFSTSAGEYNHLCTRYIHQTMKSLTNFFSTTSLSTLKHVDIEPPHRPRPPMSHEDPRDSWTPYPKQLDPVQGHLSCVSHRWCDLCCIMVTITRTFFGTEDKPSPSEIPAITQNIERQLQGWHANLPECLRISEAAVPHILNLQYVDII